MDPIDREAAIDAFEKELSAKYNKRERAIGFIGVKSILENLPSAQPDVIRCKDCKHSAHWYGDKDRCYLWAEGGIDVFKDGFCNYAERRTDE